MNDYSRQDRMEEKIDVMRIINDMAKGVKRYGHLFVLMAVVLSGLLFVQSYREYAPVYTSSATFTVTRDNSSLSNSTYINQQTAEQIIKTFPYIMNTGLIQKKIASDLNMDYIPGSISTEALGSTNMITFVVTAATPDHCQNILNSVIVNYPVYAEPVIGEVNMNLLDITEEPENTAGRPSIRDSVMKGCTMVGGFGVIFLLIYAFTRNTIHEEEDFKKYLNVDCICTIPQIIFKKRGRNFRKDISIYNKKISSNFLESIRVLRARIEKDAKKNELKTFLVTSAAPGEGKSTIAVNTAMALAMGGAKVVIVDCDLRNPSIRERLDLPEKGPGLYDILAKATRYEKVMLWSEEYKLHIIPGGRPYNNASELIDSPRMKRLLRELKEVADYIILDTAPVGMLTDTAVLAEAADAALFVVKQDYASCANILEGINQLAESKIYISGCILNGAQAGIGGYGYRYHRYGYYYGGHYGSTDSSKDKKDK